MSGVRDRTVEFLLTERAALLAQVGEIDMLLDLLDYREPEATEPEPEPRPKPQLVPALPLATRDQFPLNRRAVLGVLEQTACGATATEIGERTGIYREAVHTHLKRLLNEGRVTRQLGSMKGKHNGGRAPWVYELVVREHHIDGNSGIVLD